MIKRINFMSHPDPINVSKCLRYAIAAARPKTSDSCPAHKEYISSFVPFPYLVALPCCGSRRTGSAEPAATSIKLFYANMQEKRQ
jgi:hypothetical protein